MRNKLEERRTLIKDAQAMDDEDLRRATDRARVQDARAKGGWRLLWLLIGPGILVMLGENDGPSMISYATTGASYGIGFFLPFILVTFAMAYVVQELVLRLAMGSQRGHAQLLYERFGKFWGNVAMFDLVLGNVLTLVTEFIAVSAGLDYFGAKPIYGVFLTLVVLLLSIGTHRYWRWERLALTLALLNLVFIPAAFLCHPDAHEIGHAFLTWGPLPGGFDRNVLLLMMSNVGATITPWMLFFQQSTEVDKGLTGSDLRQGRIDTAIGTCAAAVVAVAAVVVTSVLFKHHVSAASLGQSTFAQALEKHAGHVVSTLFAVGLIEAGLLAAVTISVTSGYAFSEVRRTVSSLNASPLQAPIFYLVTFGGAALAGMVVLWPHAPLTAIELTVNVIATMLMPPALVFILMLANDSKVMGKYRNTRLQNLLAGAIALIITVMGTGYGISVLAPEWLAHHL